MKEFIYVVGNSSAAKIGLSGSPKDRIKVIQATRFHGVECETFISERCSMAESWEATAHEQLAESLIGSEMYSISFMEAVTFMKSIKPKQYDVDRFDIAKMNNEKGSEVSVVEAINNVETIDFEGVTMGSLTDLWRVGNIKRRTEGRPTANLSVFLKGSNVVEFAQLSEAMTGEKSFTVTGKGSARRTWASVIFMVYVAEQISVDFHYQVINAFINGELGEYASRGLLSDDSVSKKLTSELDKLDCYNKKEVSLLMLKKINPELTSWNFATAENLQERMKCEDSLSTILRVGVINDYEHLKSIIDKIEY